MTTPWPHPIARQVPSLCAAALLSSAATGDYATALAAPSDGCRRISEAARITRTKALVIGYEGLGSSNFLSFRQLSSYREKLAHGQQARAPLYAPWGASVTRDVMTRLVGEFKNQVQVLMYGWAGHAGPGSAAAECAALWMEARGEGTEGRKVLIVGHSFGGQAASTLAHSLQKKNVPVELVVTLDPRAPKCAGECFTDNKPGNVRSWDNFYQTSPFCLPFGFNLRGHRVRGATNHHVPGSCHMTIQRTPAAYRSIANRIRGVDSPVTVAPLVHQDRPARSAAQSDITTAGKSAAAEPSAARTAADSPGLEKAAGSVPLLASLARRSPQANPGSDEEKRFFERATAGSASSALAEPNRAEPPAGSGVLRYLKPNQFRPSVEQRGKQPDTTGASRPLLALAGGTALGASPAPESRDGQAHLPSPLSSMESPSPQRGPGIPEGNAGFQRSISGSSDTPLLISPGELVRQSGEAAPGPLKVAAAGAGVPHLPGAKESPEEHGFAESPALSASLFQRVRHKYIEFAMRSSRP